MDTRAARPSRRWPAVAGLAAIAVVLPVLFQGPGTDLDTGAVLQSGRSILDGDYIASRAPGAPVHEAAVGLLEAVGGTALSNLGSLLMAVALVVAIVLLLRREGIPNAELAAAVVVANPWFQIAATSTADFVWAMALATLGALMLRTGRPLPAGVLFGLAIGCRMSTVVVVAAAVVAELLDPPSVPDRPRRRAMAQAGTLTATVAGGVAAVVAAVVAALVYLPPFLAAGSSLAFANNDFATSTPLNHLGRAFAKDLYFFGPYASIALVAALPAVRRAQGCWRSNWTLRFGTVGLVGSQLLFLRFPWKMGHLVPTLVCLALVLGVALARHPRLLAAIVALELAFCVVNIELFRPDTPNDARGARFELDVRWGPFVTDTRCRAEDEDAWVDNDQARLEAVWNCAKPWGNGP
jgi:hypothetical protein